MSIVSLQAENVKRLKAVFITPKGRLVVVGGQNAQGKSSVLDAIAMALGGKNEIPLTPVRIGEDKAFVILKTKEFTVTRRFTATGGTSLTVENADGLKFSSPQEVINKVTAQYTFDPVAFMRLDAKQQVVALKNLTGLDFTTLDADRKKIYDERTSQNAIVVRTKVQAEALPQFTDAPKEAVNTEALVAELQNAEKHNAQKYSLEVAADDAGDALIDAEKMIASITKELADAEARVTKFNGLLAEHTAKLGPLKEKVDAAKKTFVDFVLVDKSAITSKLAEAAVTNQRVEANKQRDDKLAELAAETKKAADLTAKLDAIDKQKSDQLSAAKFPVPGLSFNDTGILYNGIALEQASSAEKLRVCVAIAAAMSKGLRTMYIRDGSLLDDTNMALLEKLAEEFDLQVWIERVGTDKHTQVIIEDGSVAGPAEDNTAPLPLVES